MQRILFTSTPLPKSIPSIFYSKIGEFKVLFKSHGNYETEKNFSSQSYFPSRVSFLKKRSVYHKMQNSHHVMRIGGVHNSVNPIESRQHVLDTIVQGRSSGGRRR